MSSLNVVRALQSKDLDLVRKVEIAWGALSLVEQANNDDARLPGGIIGQLHFVRYLFQWTLSTLTRAASGLTPAKQDPTQPGGPVRPENISDASSLPNTKKRKAKRELLENAESTIPVNAAGPNSQGAPLVSDSRLWALLRACLFSDKLGADTPISASLLQAVSAVLVSDAPRDTQQRVELDAIVSGVLTVLASRFERAFRPSLEQWATTAEAALAQPPLSSAIRSNLGPPVMGQTILVVLRGLNAACRAHPNPRKVFTLQVGRLLRPLLRARSSLQGAISQSRTSGQDTTAGATWSSSGSGEGSSWESETLLVLEGVLQGGVFHGVHMAGYPEVCQSLEEPGQAEEAADGLEDVDGMGGEEGGKRKRKRRTGDQETGDVGAKTKLASYHRLLFQALEAGVNEHDEAVIGSLEWFLRAYVAAGKQEHEDLGLTGSLEEGRNPVREPSPEDGPPPTAAPAEAAKKHRPSSSEATFRVFAELMRPLLQQLEAKEPDFGALLGTVRGCRLLLAAANEVHAYVPTEDTPSRAHYRFLDRVKAAVLTTDPAHSSASSVDRAAATSATLSQPAPLPTSASLAGQVLGFVATLLETEYRVLDGDLVQLWSMLLQAAEAEPGQAPQPDGREAPFTKQWLAEKAVRLGSRLLEVYSDLRQGEHVLASMTDALCARPFPGGPSPLVCSPPFLKALSRVVQKLPMGQAAPLLRMVARDQGTLLERLAAGQDCPSIPALTELHVSVLDNIHVTEGNAVAVGIAARAILHSAVAPHLASKLRSWAQRGVEAKADIGAQKSTAKKRRRETEGAGSQGSAQEGEMSAEGVGNPTNVMLLRVFLSARSLHEHAVGLMPPAAATKAAAALLNLEPSLGADREESPPDKSAGETSVYSVEERSIFAAIGCGDVRLSAVIGSVRVRLGACPAFSYALDCLVLHEQERLSRAVKRLEVGLANGGSGALLASLQSEVKALLGWLLCIDQAIPIEGQEGLSLVEHSLDPELGKSKKRKNRPLSSTPPAGPPSDGSDPGADRSDGWDGVQSTLTGRSYPAARWRIVCESVDLWAPLAAPKECTTILRRVLETIVTEGAEKEAPSDGSPQPKPRAPFSVQDASEELAGEEDSSLMVQIAGEMVQELTRTEPPPIVTAHASTLQLLRSAAFYEQAPFQRQLPALVLDQLWACISAVTTRMCNLGEEPETGMLTSGTGRKSGAEVNGEGSGSEREVPGGLERCDSLLRFLGRLGGGFLLPADMGRSLDVLARVERHLLAAALSALPTPLERIGLLSSIAQCRATFERILASNSATLFQLPQPIASDSRTFEAGAAAEPHFPEAGWGTKEEVEGLLNTVEGCAQASASIPDFSVAPITFSTAGSIHTLTASALEAVGFAPLQSGQVASTQEEGPSLGQARKGQAAQTAAGLADSFLSSAFEAVSKRCEQASSFLAREHSAQSSATQASRAGPPPASLLPRTVLLAAKHRGTGRGTAIGAAGESGAAPGSSKTEGEGEGRVLGASGTEGPQERGGDIVGWTEAASAAASAGALFTAVEEVMEKRDQACRAGRGEEMTWEAPSATWQAAIGRLESSVVECLSILVGCWQDTALLAESETGESTGEKGKGRRSLRGNLEGLETVLSGAKLERGRLSEQTGGEADTSAFIRELFSGTGEVAQLKRVAFGELFAAAGSVVRIHSHLASPHVRKPSSLATGDSAGIDGELGDVIGEGTNEKPKKKKRKGGEVDGVSEVSESTGADATESGSRKKKRKVSKEASEVEAETVPAEPTVSKHASPSPTLAALGRHLAAASDVITSFLQRADLPSVEPSSEGRQQTETLTQGTQMLAHLVSFLEAAGGCLPLLYPAPPIAAFDWLVETHLSLLGASSTSTSHQQRSPSRPQTGGLEAALSAVRSRAEASFGTLIRGASRQQLLRVFQAVERDMARGEGGTQTEAAVGALAVLLESVSGPKSLRLFASHAPRLLSVLFSVIGLASGRSQLWPATSSAGLLTSSLKVLTTFVSREALFPLTAAQVGLALSVPASAFATNPALTRGSQDPPSPAPSSVLATISLRPSKGGFRGADVDTLPAIFGASTSAPGADVAAGECTTLCAASRLLQAVLRHRPKEVRRCAALLVGSLQAMLQAIAAWSQDAARQEATNSACAALRRVYEEVANHKASLSHYCMHMLADYLAALCGLTASKHAISRDAASTLRSGIFALFDSCSPYDLQQLHASLGADATRRNALAALRQDYEKRHKYTGKV